VRKLTGSGELCAQDAGLDGRAAQAGSAKKKGKNSACTYCTIFHKAKIKVIIERQPGRKGKKRERKRERKKEREREHAS